MSEYHRPYCRCQAEEIGRVFVHCTPVFPKTILPERPRLWPIRTMRALQVAPEMTAAQRKAIKNKCFYRLWLRQELLHRMQLIIRDRQNNTAPSFVRRIKRLEEAYENGFYNDFFAFRRQKGKRGNSRESQVRLCPICRPHKLELLMQSWVSEL